MPILNSAGRPLWGQLANCIGPFDYFTSTFTAVLP